MALRDKIVLKRGQVLLISANSGIGIAASDASFVSASVALASDLSDTYETGDIVLFNSTKAMVFQISGDTNTYYLTDESNLQIKEA